MKMTMQMMGKGMAGEEDGFGRNEMREDELLVFRHLVFKDLRSIYSTQSKHKAQISNIKTRSTAFFIAPEVAASYSNGYRKLLFNAIR